MDPNNPVVPPTPTPDPALAATLPTNQAAAPNTVPPTATGNVQSPATQPVMPVSHNAITTPLTQAVLNSEHPSYSIEINLAENATHTLEPVETPTEVAPRSRRPLIAAALLLLLVVGGAGGWLVTRDETSSQPGPVVSEPGPDNEPEGEAPIDTSKLRARGTYLRYYRGDDHREFVREDSGKSARINWGGRAPKDLPNDQFSIRLRTYVTPPKDGDYTFYVRADDKIRLWMVGQNRLSEWGGARATSEYQTVTLPLKKGQGYSLRLDYVDLSGDAAIELLWSGPGLNKSRIPNSALRQPPDSLKR